MHCYHTAVRGITGNSLEPRSRHSDSVTRSRPSARASTPKPRSPRPRCDRGRANGREPRAHLFVFLQVAAPRERLVAVLARVRVGGVADVGRDTGCRGGRDVRRRPAVVTAVMVDRCGTWPAVAGGAAVRRRVLLRHGRAPRRRGLLGARLARAAQRF